MVGRPLPTTDFIKTIPVILKRAKLNWAASPLAMAALFLTQAIGCAGILVCVSFLVFHLSFDRWLPEGNRIVRIETTIRMPGSGPTDLAVVPSGAKAWLRNVAQRADAESVTFFRQRPITAHVEGRALSETLTLVDTAFFDILPIHSTKRLGADEVLLSSAAAIRAFGRSDSLPGRPYELPGIGNFIVRSVFDIPANSHLVFDVIAARDEEEILVESRSAEDWLNVEEYAYMKLRAPSSITVASDLGLTLESYLGAVRVGDRDVPATQLFAFLPVDVHRIHLESKGRGQLKQTHEGAAIDIVLSLFIVLAILTLTSASALALVVLNARSRELNIRRISGESQRRLASRILVDFGLSAAPAIFIAIAIAYFVSPLMGFDPVAARWLIGHGPALFATLSILFGASILAAGLSLSIRALPNVSCGLSGGRSQSLTLRRWLFGAQVTIVCVGVALTANFGLILLRQMSLPKGFDLAHVRVVREISNHDRFESSARSLQAELSGTSAVRSAAFISDIPGRESIENTTVRVASTLNADALPVTLLSISPGLRETLQMQLVSGRDFDWERADDMWLTQGEGPSRGAALINEALLPALGYVDASSVLGTSLSVGRLGSEAVVIGVMRDARFEGVGQPVRPTLFLFEVATFRHALIASESPTAQASTAADAVIEAFLPGAPITLVTAASLWDEQFEEIKKAFRYSSFLTVVIATLVLFGAVSYAWISVQYVRLELALLRLSGSRPRSLVQRFIRRSAIPIFIGGVTAAVVAPVLLALLLVAPDAYQVLSLTFGVVATALSLVLISAVTAFILCNNVTGGELLANA